MKKVLIIITTSFVSYGGLTTVMMNYYRFMDKTNLIIDFASTNKNITKDLQNELDSNNSKYFYLGDRKKETITYLKNLNRVLKEEKYDVVHINANSTTAMLELIMAKFNGVKNRIVHIHNSTGNHKTLHYFLRPFFATTYTNALACSKKAGEWAFSGSYDIVNNAINTNKFKYSETINENIREKYKIPQDCLVIGHSGKINRQKNHDFLIDVYNEIHKKNNNSKLLLVGDGELREKIEQKVRLLNLEDSVVFLGMVSNVNELLSVMDVFVFPSLWEGLPLSLIEAQAAGLRCFASDRVTKEADLTGQVIYLGSDKTALDWCDCILENCKYNRSKVCEDNIKCIKHNHYDVQENVRQLMNVYMKE